MLSRSVLRAVAMTVVPDAAAFDAAAWAEWHAIVDGQVAGRQAALRRQLSILIAALEWLPLLRYGRTFTALSSEQRTRVLTALERAPLRLLRRGVWGLRTLCFMGYYGRAGAAPEIGYRADPRGWSARR